MQENKKILLATSNQGKIKEFKKIFSNFHLISQDELGITEPIEDGLTFIENALIKARNGANKSGIYTIADDSGIEVDALDGRPGVYSARYGGTNLSDEDRVQLLLRELVDVPTEKRTCRYRVILVLARPDGSEILSEGKCEGSIAHKPIGLNGFGYDPIFLVDNSQVSMAELSPEQKDLISHRGMATKKMIQLLQSEGGI